MFLILRRIEREIVINILTSLSKELDIFIEF